MRCATVGSEIRNARAISPVVSPRSNLTVSATRASEDDMLRLVFIARHPVLSTPTKHAATRQRKPMPAMVKWAMPCQVAAASSGAPGGNPQGRVGPEHAGPDEAQSVGTHQSAGEFAVPGAPEPYCEPGCEETGDDEIRDVDPPEVTVGEQAPGMAGEVEPFSSQRLDQRGCDVDRPGEDSEMAGRPDHRIKSKEHC
jgi:hypothetical protein